MSGFWTTVQEYYQAGKDWLDDSYVGYAAKELYGGYKYGDTEYSMSAAGDASFLYMVGDYAEGAVRRATDFYGTYKAGKGALQQLGVFTDEADRERPTFQKIKSSAGSGYNEGTFSSRDVQFAQVGSSDGRVREMMAAARSSQIPSVRLTMERTGLTTRGGRLTMGIPGSPSINVRSSTKVS